MRGSIPKRYMIISLILYVSTFLFFFIFNNIQFPQKTIDLYFKSGWIINRSALQFFENLIPVQCLAVLFTFSVFYPDSGIGLGGLSSKAFNQLVTLVIVITLFLAALFFIGNEIFKPGFHSRIDSYEYLTKTSRTYLSQAEDAAEDGKYLKAQNLIERYLAIKTDDKEGLEMYKTVSERITNQFSIAEDIFEEDKVVQNARNLSYDDALRLSRSYLELEDYYSAYYYSRIATELSGSSEDARALTSEAWAALLKTEPSKEDSEEFDLFSRKKRGTELLLSRKPIDAYYLFNELKIDYPDDPDVRKYHAESIDATKNLTYFIDEAEQILNFPGVTGICCLNVNSSDQKELLFIGKMVTLAEGTFFENIEVMAFSPGAGVNKQMTARFGKLVGNHIVLNGIDRENKNIRIFPEYQISDSIPEIFNTLKLNVPPHFLNGLSSSTNIYKKLNMLELIEFEPLISSFGRPVEPLYVEIIYRVLKPFSFMILSFLILAFSWKYRRYSGKTPIAGIILSPVVIYITSLFAEAYIYAVQILCSFIFLSSGKAAAVSLLIVSQVVLLTITLVLISSMNLKGTAGSERA